MLKAALLHKKTGKKLLSTLLSLLLIIGICPLSGLTLTVAAASVDELTFTLSGDGSSYAVTGCSTSASGALAIPATYNGMPVTSIGSSAFYGCTGLTSVTIPDSVTIIGGSAFGYCISSEYETIKLSYFKIYCYSGTAGYNYAVENGFEYKLLTGEEIAPADGSGLTVTNADARILSGIYCGDTVEAVLGKLTSAKNVKLYDLDGNEVTATNTKLGTGMVLKKFDAEGKVLDEITVSVKGDTDGDGVVTTSDAREALRAAAKLTVLNGAQTLAAEVDGDSTGISTSDARILLRVAAKLETI